jgi:hypothetical protein
MTRWQAERSGWQEAVQQDEAKLSETIQQIAVTLHTFEEQDHIKKAMDVNEFINPDCEIVEDEPRDDALVERIAATYSIEPEDVSDSGEDTDTHIPIRPAQAISALDTLRQWELEQDDGNRDVVRQLDAIERRIKALQVTRKEQRTLDS